MSSLSKLRKNDTGSKVQSFDFVPLSELQILAFGCFSNQSSWRALTLFSRQCFTAFANWPDWTKKIITIFAPA